MMDYRERERATEENTRATKGGLMGWGWGEKGGKGSKNVTLDAADASK